MPPKETASLLLDMRNTLEEFRPELESAGVDPNQYFSDLMSDIRSLSQTTTTKQLPGQILSDFKKVEQQANAAVTRVANQLTTRS
jgi:monomeric isocitrate dehydrogenase